MILNRRICGFLAATFMAVVAFAQWPAGNTNPPNSRLVLKQPDKVVTYASAADVAALVDRAKKERKDNVPLVVGKILQLGPNNVYLEYRPYGKSFHWPAGVHPKADELFYVLQGAGTMVTGGKMTADHMGIDGGETQKVSKGDFIFLPEGSPHWVSQVDRTLVIMSVQIPRAVPAQ